jgi:threonylcarbamoyladenosine tRNA methylthiotransferase MtaB
MNFAIYTLGCKLNQAESELLARRFVDAGYSMVNSDSANVHIVNTCTVTHIADRKSRHLVRMLRKKNPQALIVATGCYAQRAPDELAQVGAGLVVGNEKKMQLVALIKGKTDERETGAPVITANNSRVRSFVKIQDGCNDGCAYCIVPRVRGLERSVPAKEIINEVTARVFDGHKEIVLTGSKIGDYSHSGVDLSQLIKGVLSIEGLERLHISSLQPQDISPALLELWHDARLCHHFHIALQSGSNSVLRRMERRYSLDSFSNAVYLIRKMVPDVAITTDIMVGFPGETAEEFDEGYRFCNELDLAAIHVFTYSARPGTLADGMPAQISDRVKKQRSLKMLRLAKDSAVRFQKRFLGKDLSVLWESEVKPGSDVYSGLSQNYIRTFTRSDKPLDNQLCSVSPTRLDKEGLWVEIKNENKD